MTVEHSNTSAPEGAQAPAVAQESAEPSFSDVLGSLLEEAQGEAQPAADAASGEGQPAPTAAEAGAPQAGAQAVGAEAAASTPEAEKAAAEAKAKATEEAKHWTVKMQQRRERSTQRKLEPEAPPAWVPHLIEALRPEQKTGGQSAAAPVPPALAQAIASGSPAQILRATAAAQGKSLEEIFPQLYSELTGGEPAPTGGADVSPQLTKELKELRARVERAENAPKEWEEQQRAAQEKAREEAVARRAQADVRELVTIRSVPEYTERWPYLAAMEQSAFNDTIGRAVFLNSQQSEPYPLNELADLLDQAQKESYQHMYSRLSGTGDPAAKAKAPPSSELGNRTAAQGQGDPLASAGNPGQSATAISNADNAETGAGEMSQAVRDEMAGNLLARAFNLGSAE